MGDGPQDPTTRYPQPEFAQEDQDQDQDQDQDHDHDHEPPGWSASMGPAPGHVAGHQGVRQTGAVGPAGPTCGEGPAYVLLASEHARFITSEIMNATGGTPLP